MGGRETIWAVTMVRNEEDILGAVVLHLLAEGVDHVLIADNLSTDGTREMLDELATSHPVTVVDDPDPAYRQAEKMTALAHRAAASGATWILPFDADELWISRSNSLGAFFSSLGDHIDIVSADLFNHYPPLLPRRGHIFDSMTWRDKQPGSTKVAYRYRPDISLMMGNHDATSEHPLRRVEGNGLEVHHYGYRRYRQMVMKSRQGREAIMLTNLPPEICWHWRLNGSRSGTRLALTWARIALRRRGLVRDRRLPSDVIGGRSRMG